MNERCKVLRENNYIRDFTGVTKFHNAGYFGSRVTAATGEDFIPSRAAELGHEVIAPVNGFSGWNFHGLETALTFWEVAPQAKLVMVPYNEDVSINGVSYRFNENTLSLLAAHGVSCMFLSVIDVLVDKAARDNALDNYPSFFYATGTGNDGAADYNPLTECKNIFGVGAYVLVGGKAVPADFSSETKHADFCAPTYVKVEPFIGDVWTFGGVSCSTPYLIGMVALINDFFIDKTGIPLTRDMMYRFLVDHSVDIGTLGKDNKTGWGAVILPDPSEIDIGRYVPLEIKMVIGKSTMTVNGVEKTLDQAPVIAATGRTLAPVRAIFEAAGLTVSWDAATQTITATR